MADVGKFFGSLLGAAGPAQAPAAIVSSAEKILSYFKLDPNLKAQLADKLTTENIDLEKSALAAELAQAQGQLAINEQEAAAAPLAGKFWAGFIAGWRPAVGWVCVAGLFWAKIGQPFAVFLMAALHWQFEQGQVPLPTVDLAGLLELLVPMLGIATLRSAEKITNSEGNR